ncbi:CPCC family cysteine-rich protein [Thalassolituus hydrocarboniclasticus]|uniref:Cysteine-rich CPCC domain-containing protein n=1 Tax=Thalassolituus hydrocarboniclasticus TaxID=2742796 RepID=A0ABY6A8Y7_9GAMM|nr:hypothetical protein HUF19_02215 [Thalassolituus hydrocarboniclasticus]
MKPQSDYCLPCPCCGFKTIGEAGAFEICPVCCWEDDGQSDADSSIFRGGPNGELSLELARENFAKYGACAKEYIGQVRSPNIDEM